MNVIADGEIYVGVTNGAIDSATIIAMTLRLPIFFLGRRLYRSQFGLLWREIKLSGAVLWLFQHMV